MKEKINLLTNTINRGMVLEQLKDGIFQSIPLVDLLPEGSLNHRGTYKISIEFIPNEDL